MKRNIVLALVAAIAISMVAVGVTFAQGPGPGGNGVNTGTNVNMEVTLSNYMPSAMAEALGLSVDEINAQLASGETFYTIALAQGYTDDQLSVLMNSVRAKAIDLAIVDGTITVEQATFLLTNQTGIYDGTCIPQNNAISMNNTYSYMYNTGNETGTGVCDGDCIPQSTSSATDGSMRRTGGRR